MNNGKPKTEQGRRKQSFKSILRDDCLKALQKSDWPYVSLREIRHYLAEHQVAHTSASLNRYMVEFEKAGLLHGCGRGWYSFLPTPLTLDEAPAAEMVKLLRGAFPLLRFTCWSTAQVNPWMHHLIGTPTIFVMTEKDALPDVAGRLRTAGWECVVNPRGALARDFAPGPRTVVLRALHSSAPAPETGGGPADPEQLLVELRLEAEELNLLPVAEFQETARQMTASGRVNMGALLYYAAKCYLKEHEIFG